LVARTATSCPSVLRCNPPTKPSSSRLLRIRWTKPSSSSLPIIRLANPGSISTLSASFRIPATSCGLVAEAMCVLLSSPSTDQALSQFARSARVIRELLGANTSEGLPAALKRFGRPSTWINKPGALRCALPLRSIQLTRAFSQMLLPTSPMYGTATTGIRSADPAVHFLICSVAAATGPAAPEGLYSTAKRCEPARRRTSGPDF
jgi:hypothetical protein